MIMIAAPNLEAIPGLVHGFGLRDSVWPPEVTLVRQIHSDIVWDAERINEPNPEGDALVSRSRLVGVKTADCVPILLADPETGSVASIHAGWRGTALDIAAKTVEELTRRWNVRPENLRAAVGPAIGGCCYEVGPEVAHRFGIPASGPVHIDLAGINRRCLAAVGVRDIWVSGECTFCSPDRFFSFRRERDEAGRMLSYIGWQKHDGRAV
jgi:YfiH family protein